MASPYPATIVNLSSGQLLFNDPTENPPWDPESLGSNPPVFPSTSLAIGVQGTISERNLESIAFTNVFRYQPYEVSTVVMQKSLIIDQTGVITYEDPRVGAVDTVSAPFSANVNTFLQSTIGGVNILDTLSGTPDTLTNALGKLDGWIANAFLFQPPAVNLIELDNTSLYSGIRWINPRVYNVMDKSVPYVTGIVVIVGDASSPDVLTLEINDCTFFPYKGFRDGISPYFNPLVRFRIFTDFFPTTADVLYTKAVMKTKCIDIIDEKGHAQIPDLGKVFAVDYTDHQSSYTTISLYLPNLPNAYPKGTPVPIQIVYINKTEGDTNAAYGVITVNTEGAPSELIGLTPLSADVSSLRLQTVRPVFSDALSSITAPYFSTYSLQYTFENITTAHADGIGFRYGCNSPTDVPSVFTDYVNSTMTQNFIYSLSTQNIPLTGSTDGNPLVPAVYWSTTGYSINSAYLLGENTAGPLMSTLFPRTVVPSISSATISNVSYGQTRYYNAGFLKYLQFQNGWNTGYNVSTDVFYMSTPTTLAYQLNSTVQFNDPTFPGDRSTISVYTRYTNTDAKEHIPNTLEISTFQADFPLNAWQTQEANNSVLSTIVRDTYVLSSFQKYLYGAQIAGNQYVSTISTSPQLLQVCLANNRINGFNDPIEQNTIHSTAKYMFETEPSQPPSTLNVVYTNTCISTVKVSGIDTPSLTSKFMFDIVSRDFARFYSAPEFGHAYIAQGATAIGPVASYSTNVRIYKNSPNTEITSLPFPVSTLMRLSTCGVGLYSTVYQNPNEPSFINIFATITPANPQGRISTFVSTLTSSIFIDTVSLTTYSTFANIRSTNGVRVISMLPRPDIGITPDNIVDGVDLYGNHGIGLNVNMNPYFIVGNASNITFSTGIIYQHASSISSIYTDYYSRELIYTRSRYIHPAGFTFNNFDGKYIGVPNATYPDFTYDLIYDENNGFRYATFAFESPVYSEPTNLQFLNVRIKNPNIVSTISEDYYTNSWFPNIPTVPYLMSTLKVRLHTKLYASYTDSIYRTMSTAWLDGLKLVDDSIYNDQIYDTAACFAVSTIGNDVEYKVQIHRRAYNKLCAVVRIGLSKDSGLYAGDFPYSVSFDAIETYYSDF